MRHLRMASGLAAVVCALGVAAASASASEFEASGGTTAGLGVSKNEEFRVYPMTIDCAKATTIGSVEAGKSETFTNEAKYSSCTTFNGLVKVTVSPGHFEYNANGTVAITAPITITPAMFKCHYEIPAQASFSKESVFYSDVTAFNNKKFPNGQQKIQVESALQGMEYIADGWPCTGPKNPAELIEGRENEETGTEGKFNGKLEEKVNSGNFTWLKA
jgi:hypothetical protein